ncbi:TetR/AcrR family transcriptional regulator [Nesterenkonia muleiensis]|uniref:TetR/AcrR family transcriptional regulator n=1 Tax=Nesterenkonia muleiensis TaxID=2282648 RepID=UPI001300894D|nr:TetR/AcrR family transcriptional regulator [Nesterenkonia muleiensis]
MSSPRSPEAERLLGLVVEHILNHGVQGVTLHALARAAGSNNRMLLYYFGSKEALISQAIYAAYDRSPGLHQLLPQLKEEGELAQRLCRGWRTLRARENRAFLRLFFEMFAIAIRQPESHSRYLLELRDRWYTEIETAFLVHGWESRAAGNAALQLLALWRGLQFSLLAGSDTDALDSAHDTAVAVLLTTSAASPTR